MLTTSGLHFSRVNLPFVLHDDILSLSAAFSDEPPVVSSSSPVVSSIVYVL